MFALHTNYVPFLETLPRYRVAGTVVQQERGGKEGGRKVEVYEADMEWDSVENDTAVSVAKMALALRK